MKEIGDALSVLAKRREKAKIIGAEKQPEFLSLEGYQQRLQAINPTLRVQEVQEIWRRGMPETYLEVYTILGEDQQGVVVSRVNATHSSKNFGTSVYRPPEGTQLKNAITRLSDRVGRRGTTALEAPSQPSYKYPGMGGNNWDGEISVRHPHGTWQKPGSFSR